MTETTTDDLTMDLSLTFRDPENSSITLRQVALGYQPLVLIEIDPDAATEDSLPVSIDCTFFGPEKLADLLEMLAEAVRQGVPDYKAELAARAAADDILDN